MAVKKIKSEKKEKKPKKREMELDEEEEAEQEELGEKLNEELGNVEELKELEGLINSEGEEIKNIEIKASKPISGLKKGDKIRVDGKELEIDAHYTLIDHGKTKEMTIELFDPKTDKDYQLRYFSDQVETSMEFYELEEILYVKKQASRIEW